VPQLKESRTVALHAVCRLRNCSAKDSQLLVRIAARRSQYVIPVAASDSIPCPWAYGIYFAPDSPIGCRDRRAPQSSVPFLAGSGFENPVAKANVNSRRMEDAVTFCVWNVLSGSYELLAKVCERRAKGSA
jgi:hypothetical protein